MPTDPVLEAFTRIRVAAENHMDQRDLARLGWSEETITDISVHQGAPTVQVVPFTKPQEGRGVGADYLWWWLDTTSDECFGMLVQAKRMTISRGRPAVKVNHRGGQQLRDLLQTAKDFEVPAVYGVYTGGRVYRKDLRCYHASNPATCTGCRRMAISMISTYQVLVARKSSVDVGSAVINESVSLEDLVDPSLGAGRVRDVNLRQIPQGPLRDFLINDQDGPREVAKRLFKMISRRRAGAFSAAIAEPVAITSESVFTNVPQDRGHFPRPYFEHVLRGLRATPPDYVHELLRGGRPSTFDSRIAGIVLVRS